MEIKKVIEQALKKHNKNLIGSQELTLEGSSLILSLNEKKNQLALVAAYISIALGGYFIYQRYIQNSPAELWHWALVALGIYAIINRKKLSNKKTIINTESKTIKHLVGSRLVNSISFSDATDFFIDSVKMKGGGFGISSVVYVNNEKGKIMLGVLHEQKDTEEYLELLKEIFIYKGKS